METSTWPDAKAPPLGGDTMAALEGQGTLAEDFMAVEELAELGLLAQPS